MRDLLGGSTNSKEEQTDEQVPAVAGYNLLSNFLVEPALYISRDAEIDAGDVRSGCTFTNFRSCCKHPIVRLSGADLVL